MTKKQILSLLGIFIVGFGLMVTATVAKKNKTTVKWDGEPYNIENVNPIDAKFARPYNETLDNLGDVFVGLVGLVVCVSIAVVFFSSEDKSKAFKTAVLDFFYCGINFIY